MSKLQIHRLNNTVEEFDIKIGKTETKRWFHLFNGLLLTKDYFTSMELQFDRTVEEEPKVIKKLFINDGVVETWHLDIVRFSILRINKPMVLELLYHPDSANNYSLSMTNDIYLKDGVKVDKLFVIR